MNRNTPRTASFHSGDSVKALVGKNKGKIGQIRGAYQNQNKYLVFWRKGIPLEQFTASQIEKV